MFVYKRDGKKEEVKFEKISKRIARAAKGLKNVDTASVAQKVINGVFDGVSSMELDKLSTEIAYSLSVKHPDYDRLAINLAISALHKDTPDTFSECIEKLYKTVKNSKGDHQLLISSDIYKIIKKNAHVLNNAIDYSRDYKFDYFGFKTLERSYLLKLPEIQNEKVIHKIVERPQHLWMRVAVGIHGSDMDAVINTYEMLSNFNAVMATPCLYNSSMPKNNLSSCFLLGIDDSVSGIYNCLKDCAEISQSAGGIGVHISNIRAKGSPIFGTNGVSNGVIPMLKVFESTARYIDQGGGKRKGSFAIYLEPQHFDIMDFLDLRKNNGKEELRARDLNLALWTPDLFFERVEADADWTLMDPNKCPDLSEKYGAEFKELYESYEQRGMGERTVKARDVWNKILDSCVETGEPYILAKDACNIKSNQKNLGTIKSSNLCLDGNTLLYIKGSPNQKNDLKVQLENVVKLFKNKQELYVKSFDINKNEIVYNKIINAGLTGISYRMKLEFSNGSVVRCTPEHKFYTKKRGYIEAKDLNNEDELVNSNNKIVKLVGKWDLEGSLEVYDITVEHTENFFANDVLVHNCAEIVQYSDSESISVCNLSSVSLPSCVINNKFDFKKLEATTKNLVENLNKVIDVEYYPVEKAKKTNLRDRPMGIGIQGLGTLFAMLRFTWESDEAKQLNKDIAETMYYAAMRTSCDLAKESKPYKTFKGSPLSKGLFQFDLWNVKPSDRYDWENLRDDVKKFGVRNSLLIADMPTASTSQILGNTECFEPFTSNIYKRSTLSGDFIQVNKFLVEDLIKLNLWTEEMRQMIIANNGSVQNVPGIPDDIKALYKTVWEISQKILIDFSADRGPYVCQSQSLNLYFKDANKAKLTSAFFYGWKKGLKTIVYYTRTQGARETTKFTVDKEIENKLNAANQPEDVDGISCSLDNPEACEMCSS
jgi:ribonucleotide reductase alpha subunit